MAVRDSVREFVELGPLPDSRASEDVIARHQVLLQRISGPVADDEAALLVGCFGPDDCFGLAWTLLHLIESALGGTPIKTEPDRDDNEWVQRLWRRSNKGCSVDAQAIFQPLVAEGFEWINACDDQDYEVFATLDGRRRADTWRAVRVRRVRADHRQAFNPSDFPWLGSHAVVMRRRAADALRDILDAHGELLPLATDDDVELFVLNARVVDALDQNGSSLTKFPGTDRIMRLEKVAFVASEVRDVDIFRLPHRGSPTYVSQRFVDRVKATGLVGLEFNRVWPAE